MPFDPDPSLFANVPSFTSLHKIVERPIYVAPTAEDERNHVRLPLIPIACWRCNQGNFAFDSSFIDPSFKQGIGDLPALIRANQGSRAALFGHADPVGNDQYNKYLSGRRVKAMFALLTRQPALWEELYARHPSGDAWGDHAIQAMLGAVSDSAGAPYYTGPVDGSSRSEYKDALHRFQADNSVDQHDTADAPTRRALFPRYMQFLCGEFVMAPGAFLFDASEKDGRGAYQACSELNPVVLLPATEQNTSSKERDDDNAPNRRVLLFLFAGDVDVQAKDWPCPSASDGIARCFDQFWPDGNKRRAIGKERRDYAKTGDTMACRFYDRFARRSPCEGRPVVLPPSNTIAIKTDAPQFVPLVEQLVISYTLTGPLEHVYALRLEIATKAAPDKVLFEQLIEGPYLPTGSTTWNGEVTDEAFEQCINLASSPYLVTIVLETKGGARKLRSNSVEVAIVVGAIDIRVEDPYPIIRTDDHKRVLELLKKELVANNGVGRIILDSPVFTSGGDLTGNQAFVNYEARWQDGVEVPLVLRVLLTGKDGKTKRSPHAIAGTRVIWDLSLDDDAAFGAALDARGVSAAATSRAFIEKVSAFKKNETKPKGRNAHEHLGGLRSDDPKSFEFLGEWALDRPSTRTWAGASKCKERAKFDADTGISLKPGRMAGDAYHVRAYLDVDNALDTTDNQKLQATPAARRSNELHVTIWKRVFVHQVYTYGNDPQIDLDALTKEYKRAAHIVEKSSTFATNEMKARWKAAYKGAVATFVARGDNFVKNAALDDPEDFPARFRSFDEFGRRSHPGESLPTRILHRLRNLFGSADADKYSEQCDSYAIALCKEASKQFAPFAKQGVTIFVFGDRNAQNQDSHVGGFAGSLAGFYGGTNTAIFLFRTDAAGVAHELGHSLFLAHQSKTNDSAHPPGGSDDHAHDKSADCVMSYTDAEHLCGLCILKLSGWDTRGSGPTTKIDNDGTIT